MNSAKNKAVARLCLQVILLIGSSLPTALYSASIELSGNISLISGTSCDDNAVYRFATNTTYQSKDLDVLVKILAHNELHSSQCITYDNGAIDVLFDAQSREQIFTDLEITFVEKNTTQAVSISSLMAIFADLDANSSGPDPDETDDVYLVNHHSVNLDENTLARYEPSYTLNSSITGLQYTSRIRGRGDKNCTSSGDVPLCKGTATWLNTSVINLRMQNNHSTNKHFEISFDIDDASDITFGIDRGDAPSSYSDATHAIISGLSLGSGATPDHDAVSAFTADANGDDINSASVSYFDDEDSVDAFPALSTNDSSYDLTLAATNDTASNATIFGWIDFNRDGSFSSSESTSISVPAGSNTETYTLSWSSLPNIDSGKTYARFRLSSDSNLSNSYASGSLNNGEVEDYTLTITAAPSCTMPSGSVNAGFSPIQRLRTGNKVFLASNTPADKEGHLQAFGFESNGTLSSTVNWDASLTMSITNRRSRLFSTDSTGAIVGFNTLDATAFETNGIPDVDTIREYTINPASDDGIYLDGRRNGALLGAISPNATLGLLDNTLNVLSYLDDASYRTYFDDVISQRSDASDATIPSRVLFTSDDGFLYAFNQYDGALAWGWMPRSLTKELKDFSTFQNKHFMQGTLDILELKNGSSFATFVVGSYRDGLGQFVLRLNSDGGLDAQVWDSDYFSQSNLITQAPNHGKRAYFSDNNDQTYTAFITTNLHDESILHIRSITSDTTDISVPLTFTVTSTPFISGNLGSSNAPLENTLYLGSAVGTIHAVSLFTGNTLKSASQIANSITEIGGLGNSSTSAVTFIGMSNSSKSPAIYLRAQSKGQLTIFTYNASNSTWENTWTSYVTGAGKWATANAVLSADTSIQALPAGSTITDEAYVVSNSIVLPVMHLPSGTNCFGSAHYYLYNLNDGHFPNQTFFNSNDNSVISSTLTLGYGRPKSLHLTDLVSQQKLLGIGIAGQTSSQTTGVNKTFFIKDNISSGIRSWRLIH